MNHRIGMMFTPGKGWVVTQCYDGNGPVPLVRTYKDGSKELFLSATTWLPSGLALSPRDVLLHWQNRPRRKRMQTETRAARMHRAAVEFVRDTAHLVAPT